MVRWWFTVGFVVAMLSAPEAVAQTAPDPGPAEAGTPDAEPRDGGSAPERSPDGAEPRDGEVVPPDKNEVPLGAADASLIDLSEDGGPDTAPEAYPSATTPPAPAYVPPEFRPLPAIPAAPLIEDDLPRRSVGMMVTGIVLTSVGAIVALTGAAIAGDAESCEEDNSCERFDAHGYGVGLGVGGLALLGAGIPLLVVGAQRVSPEPAPSVSFSLGPGAFRLRSVF